MTKLTVAILCLLPTVPASAADVTKSQFRLVHVGMTLAQVEKALGRPGTNEGKVFYVWKTANLRVGFDKEAAVAEFDLAAPGKKNELFEKFKKAFMDKMSKEGKKLTRAEIEAIVGEVGKKTELAEYVWRNSNKARVRVILEKGKVRETAATGRLE
jgi:hypothetical protein